MCQKLLRISICKESSPSYINISTLIPCKKILTKYVFSRYRRVHITKTTLDYLGDKFEVEPGNGPTREQYLADHKVDTYLILPPKVREKDIE